MTVIEYFKKRFLIIMRSGLLVSASWGVVALLDKGYGKTILHSLPKAPQTGSMADVEQFFSLLAKDENLK
jgi:hypothetical protein